MNRFFDFRCPNGHVTELLIRDDRREILCECGLMAGRALAAPRSRLDPLSGDFPSASDAWVNRREDHMKKERKHKENHGTEWIGQSAGYMPKK
jgi:hypothetical protein